MADGIRRVRSSFVNWYLIEDGARLAAVDAGPRRGLAELEATLAALGRSPRELVAIVLTHAHVDHIGFAEAARRRFGTAVYVPEGDVGLARHPLLRLRSERLLVPYLRNASARSLVVAMVRTGAIRPRALRSFETYRDGETLELVPGAPRALATPGHTAGHMALHLPDRDVLFTGDALVTVDPLTGRTGPRRVGLGFTQDADDAARSLDAVAATGAGTLLPGHGDPWTGGAVEAARLAREAGQD